MPDRPRLLLVTDLAYPARGRRYGDEDVELARHLRRDLTVALCHPVDAVALMDAFDVVLVRNSGPVAGHAAAYDAFRAAVAERGTRVANPLCGRGDMAGKQYLVDLTRSGHRVIPTVDRPEDLGLLPPSERCVVKPKDGADSIGLEVLPRAEVTAALARAVPGALLAQPLVDLVHEISFYVLDGVVHEVLFAPDPERRWELEPYAASDADLAFARSFVDWNALPHGIERVDACRTRDGDLLLVELEDLNPFLSLDRWRPAPRADFVEALGASLVALADRR